jgi:protein SCO1/2
MFNISAVKRFIILVLILIVPGFLYYLLQAKGKNRYKPLPIYGPKQVAQTFHKVRGKVIYDTIYHQVQDFKLYDQDSNVVTQNSFKGKVLIVNFFFTNCPTLCKEISKNMAELTGNYKKNNLLKFVSITVDPKTDRPSVLKSYARSLSANENQWRFLTGDTTTIYSLSRNGLLLSAVNGNNNPENYVYSEKLILLDQERRIRGYYNGTSVNDMVKLNDEIKVLIAEELRNIKDNLY